MEWVSGNVFIRLMGDREGLKPGQVVAGHTHNFDHTSIFFCGRWRVKKWVPVVREPFGESVLSPVGIASAKPTPGNGSPVAADDANGGANGGEWAMLADFEREGPFHLLIEAHARHEFTFLGPGVGKAWCVYSHRTPQGEVAVDYTGWWDGYR
jgi:hypothetical protein